MATADLLLQEFNEEAQKTRKTLERVPEDKRTFVPHAKSMPLDRLAALVAQLPEFGVIVLTTSELDFGQGKFTPLKFESAKQLVKAFDDGANQLKAVLQNTKESAWAEPWKLGMKGTVLFEGSRFMGSPTNVPESPGAPPRAAGRVLPDEWDRGAGDLWAVGR